MLRQPPATERDQQSVGRAIEYTTVPGILNITRAKSFIKVPWGIPRQGGPSFRQTMDQPDGTEAISVGWPTPLTRVILARCAPSPSTWYLAITKSKLGSVETTQDHACRAKCFRGETGVPRWARQVDRGGHKNGRSLSVFLRFRDTGSTMLGPCFLCAIIDLLAAVSGVNSAPECWLAMAFPYAENGG